MAARLYLDTHAVAWLHQGALRLFTAKGLDLIENLALAYSPATLLELQFLFGIGRLTTPGQTILRDLRQEIGLEVCPESYLSVMEAACLEDWTRDPFDRAITAHARLQQSPLLSRDREIHLHYDKAVW